MQKERQLQLRPPPLLRAPKILRGAPSPRLREEGHTAWSSMDARELLRRRPEPHPALHHR